MRAATAAALILCSGIACAQQHPTAPSQLYVGIGTNGEVEVARAPFEGASPFEPHAARWLDLRPQLVTAPLTVRAAGRPRGRGSIDPAIDTAVQRAAALHGVAPDLLHAVIKVESNYRHRVVSRSGAAGLMQLMPATAKRFGVSDRFNIEQNVAGGAAYLKWLSMRFSGNLDLVLAAYNAGEGAVQKHGNRIPPYRETREYVTKVRAHFVAFHE